MDTEIQVEDLDDKGNVIRTTMVRIEDVEVEPTKKQILHSITTSK